MSVYPTTKVAAAMTAAAAKKALDTLPAPSWKGALGNGQPKMHEFTVATILKVMAKGGKVTIGEGGKVTFSPKGGKVTVVTYTSGTEQIQSAKGEGINLVPGHKGKLALLEKHLGV